MKKVIAIEGIDRIGKSTFIDILAQRLTSLGETVRIEKPTIGINTLKKIGYPLQDISNIMEIRNIGLMEEFLYRIQTETHDITIIRDRFNMSELAYGLYYRDAEFAKTIATSSIEESIQQYKDWNSWFEQELDKVSKNYMIVFVLHDDSYPNEDEAISAKMLDGVNKQFIKLFDECKFENKMLIRLHKNKVTGYTDILDYIDKIVEVCTK